MDRKMLLFVAGIFLLACHLGFAAYDEDSITVDVSVQSATTIVIHPTSLTWTNVNPGSAGGWTSIDVKNRGSTNVTKLYAYVDTLTDETSNPTGSSDPSKYAAGGVITLRKNETGVTTHEHYFVGRLEWNYTDRIELSTFPAGTVAWGWFRNTTSEYVWSIKNGTAISGAGGCNSTGTSLRIESDNDVGTPTTRDTAGGNSVAGTLDATKPEWGIFSFSSGPLNGYCVAAYRDCTKLYIYKYDYRSTGNTQFDSCTNLATLNTTRWIGPSELQTINVDVWVPYGIPAGSLTQATLTMYAET